MSRRQFRAAAASATARCTNDITQGTCDQELDYALNARLLSPFAHQWARANGFYPVVDRNNVIQAVCKCGCFAADTAISTPSGEVMAGAVVAGMEVQAYAGPGELTPRMVTSTTSGAEHAELYAFTLSSGRTLRVTQNHPLVVGDGRMLAARDVSLRDGLLAADGTVATIVAIVREPASTLVHNFGVEAADASGHVVVAEGVLVGDLIWQNQLARDLGAIVIRN
jgi:hypothetical protein